MLGTILNAIGIVLGGILGLLRSQGFSPQTEHFFRVGLGAFTTFYGLMLTWKSINGPFTSVLLQLLIVVFALTLGRLTGRFLQLQHHSNRLGQHARQVISNPPKAPGPKWSAGFNTCATLYCAAPLGILGAIQDGLSGFFYPLAVKAVMEGLASAGFARLFGWSALVSALPVLAFQGTLTLLCALFARPFLDQHGLTDSINAVGGLLVFTVALVLLELKRFEIANYLPALAFAPLLTALFR